MTKGLIPVILVIFESSVMHILCCVHCTALACVEGLLFVSMDCIDWTLSFYLVNSSCCVSPWPYMQGGMRGTWPLTGLAVPSKEGQNFVHPARWWNVHRLVPCMLMAATV